MSSFSVAHADTNAVNRALAWLSSCQRADGSWSENSALNALPLLAFLSAGYVPTGEPTESNGSSDYSPVVARGIQFILTQQDNRGAFVAGNGLMYGHGMTTLLLAELTGMTQHDADLRRALERAVDLILRSQQVAKSPFYSGGWRYHPDSTDSDLSVTLWQVLALKAASDVGIPVPSSAMDQAIAFVKRCEHPQGGFGYQPGGLPGIGRTAGSLLILQLIGATSRESTARSQLWLENHATGQRDPFFYYTAHYLAHLDADFGRANMLQIQESNGSWPPLLDGTVEKKAGPLYTTSMAVLALTADYHYLPSYLR
jgi:hypothetical protein